MRPFAKPQTARSVRQLAGTVLPFCVLWAVLYGATRRGSWGIALLLIPVAGGFLSRMFVIMHDCSHRAFFHSDWANDIVGRALGLMCFTPFTYWRRTHAEHHATLGDLGRRGTGDVETLTVKEYRNLTPLRRLRYRIIRHPFTVFVIAPAYVFLFRYRLPLAEPNRTTWLSTQGTNLALLGIGVAFWHAGGFAALCLTHGPLLAIMATLAVWLFFVEHQFEDTYWADEGQWNFREAALWGSSHVDLPRALRYFTANIGPHHLHHLNCSIPNYRLYECLDQLPDLKASNRLTLGQALKATWFALWDEETQRLVRFRSLDPGATDATDQATLSSAQDRTTNETAGAHP